jgi:hypothetical protein
MKEAVSTSETSVNFYETARRNNSEDSHRHIRRRENLKSYRGNFVWVHIGPAQPNADFEAQTERHSVVVSVFESRSGYEQTLPTEVCGFAQILKVKAPIP